MEDVLAFIAVITFFAWITWIIKSIPKNQKDQLRLDAAAIAERAESIDFSNEKKKREAPSEEDIAREEQALEERKEKRRQERRLRDALAEKLSHSSSLKIIEVANIAREVTDEFDIDPIVEHAELLALRNEIGNAIKESNEVLKPKYQQAVLKSYGVEDLKNLSTAHQKIIDNEVERCMELGLKQLSLNERLRPYLEGIDDSSFEDDSNLKKRKIERGKSWEELKDKL